MTGRRIGRVYRYRQFSWNLCRRGLITRVILRASALLQFTCRNDNGSTGTGTGTNVCVGGTARERRVGLALNHVV